MVQGEKMKCQSRFEENAANGQCPTTDLRFVSCDGPRVNTADQQLTDADRGKPRQNFRKSATSRNQDSTSQDSLTDPAASDTEQP